VGTGVLFVVAGRMIQSKQKYGNELAAATAAALAGGTVPRGLRTGKYLPLMLGSVALMSCGYHVREASRNWQM